MERAMQLCREDEEEEKRRWRAGQEEELDEGGDVNSRVENLDGRDNIDGIFNVSTEPIERDMFDDSPINERNHVNEEVALSSSVAKQINFETLDMKEEDKKRKKVYLGDEDRSTRKPSGEGSEPYDKVVERCPCGEGKEEGG